MINKANYLKHRLYEPDTSHRRYDFDLAYWEDNGKRAAQIALPFLALYRPIGKTLSLGMGSCRAISHICQATEDEQRGAYLECSASIAQAALAIIALSATYFHSTTGLYVTTSVDLAHTIYLSALHTARGEYSEASEEALQAAASGLYLAYISLGHLELIMFSTLIQGIICHVQGLKDINEGRDYEACGKIAMAMVRYYQGHKYYKLIQRRDELLALQKFKDLFNRCLKGRDASHLQESPLGDLSARIDDKKVVLSNGEKEYDFGSHFHGLGKGLVKGANLAFRKVTVDGTEKIELDFKVNHVFRERINEMIAQLSECDARDVKDLLHITNSHATHLSTTLADDDDLFNAESQHVIKAHGLGTLAIGALPNNLNAYDRVVVQLDANKTVYDLHELLSLAGLETALFKSTDDDMDRLKMGHLFRTLFPKKALPFERTDEFFTLPIGELKETIIAKEPKMAEAFATYFDKMTGAEILPGRVRYRIPGLADKAREAGARALTAAITGAYGKEESNRRVASLLQLGMLSQEMREINQFEAGGLSSSAWTGGADSVYTQLITQQTLDEGYPIDAYYYGDARLLISLDALETGTYQYYTDSFGHRIPEEQTWFDNYFTHDNIIDFTKNLNTKYRETPYDWRQYGHEIMLKERIDPSYITGVIVDDAEQRNALLDHLRTRDLVKKDDLGVEKINNISVDRFFHTIEESYQ